MFQTWLIIDFHGQTWLENWWERDATKQNNDDQPPKDGPYGCREGPHLGFLGQYYIPYLGAILGVDTIL